MQKFILFSATALFAATPLFSANANEEMSVRAQPAAVMDAQSQAAAEAANDELVEDRVPEKREILDIKTEETRGRADGRIQSFENETNKGVQASATTRIDMR